MISVHGKMTTSLVAGGAALLLAVLTPVAAPAAPVTVNCAPTKMKILASALEQSNKMSNTFGNIPEASMTFTQGGASASCVIVRFSAETYAAGTNGAVLIRAILDNAPAALPTDVIYSGDDGNYATAHSYEFIFPSVAPGRHAVHMQFRSLNSTPVTVSRHNTVVQFAP